MMEGKEYISQLVTLRTGKLSYLSQGAIHSFESVKSLLDERGKANIQSIVIGAKANSRKLAQGGTNGSQLFGTFFQCLLR